MTEHRRFLLPYFAPIPAGHNVAVIEFERIPPEKKWAPFDPTMWKYELGVIDLDDGIRYATNDAHFYDRETTSVQQSIEVREKVRHEGRVISSTIFHERLPATGLRVFTCLELGMHDQSAPYR